MKDAFITKILTCCSPLHDVLKIESRPISIHFGDSCRGITGIRKKPNFVASPTPYFGHIKGRKEKHLIWIKPFVFLDHLQIWAFSCSSVAKLM